MHTEQPIAALGGATRSNSHALGNRVSKCIERHDDVGCGSPKDSGPGTEPVHEQTKSSIAATDYFDVREPGRINIRQWASRKHVSPPQVKDPNVYECAHIQALVAIESFASAVDSASAIHRFQYIMVNGVLS